MTYAINGVADSRWTVLSATTWRPPVTVGGSVVAVPGRHGVIRPSLPRFEEPTVTIQLAFNGTTSQLEAFYAELVSLLTAPGLVLTRKDDGGDRAAAARLVTITEPEFYHGRAAIVTAVLAIPGVFFRGASTDSSTIFLTSGTTMEIATLAGSTAPVTDAVLRLNGPITSFSITDVVTGTGLSWALDNVATGAYLYLDAGSLQAWKSTSASQWTPGGTDVTSGLDYPAAGPLQLFPRMQSANPTDRRVKVLINGSGFATSSAMVVRAAPAYF